MGIPYLGDDVTVHAGVSYRRLTTVDGITVEYRPVSAIRVGEHVLAYVREEVVDIETLPSGYARLTYPFGRSCWVPPEFEFPIVVDP